MPNATPSCQVGAWPDDGLRGDRVSRTPLAQRLPVWLRKQGLVLLDVCSPTQSAQLGKRSTGLTPALPGPPRCPETATHAASVTELPTVPAVSPQKNEASFLSYLRVAGGCSTQTLWLGLSGQSIPLPSRCSWYTQGVPVQRGEFGRINISSVISVVSHLSACHGWNLQSVVPSCHFLFYPWPWLVVRAPGVPCFPCPLTSTRQGVFPGYTDIRLLSCRPHAWHNSFPVETAVEVTMSFICVSLSSVSYNVTNILLNFSWLLCSSLTGSLSLCQCLSPDCVSGFLFSGLPLDFLLLFGCFEFELSPLPGPCTVLSSWACCVASSSLKFFIVFSSFTELSNFFQLFPTCISSHHRRSTPFQKTSLKMLHVRDNLLVYSIILFFFFFFISIPQMCKSSFWGKTLGSQSWCHFWEDGFFS